MAKMTLTKQLIISEYIANFLNIRLCLQNSILYLSVTLQKLTKIPFFMISSNAHLSKALFISFLYMQISLFRLFGFCNLLKLVVDKKKNLIPVQNQYIPTKDTQNVLFGGNFFVIYLECFYGLSVINTNQVTFQQYAFLKAHSFIRYGEMVIKLFLPII